MSLKNRIKSFLDFKTISLIILDALALFVASVFIYFFATGFSLDLLNFPYRHIPYCFISIVVFSIAGMIATGSYRSVVVMDHISDIARLVIGYFCGNVALLAFTFIIGLGRSIPLLAASIICGAFTLLIERMFYYIFATKLTKIINFSSSPAALIIGAGEAGRTVLSEVSRSKDHSYRIMGFVDDDPNKISRYVDNVYVYGPTVLIPELCSKYNIDVIIFAIPTCSEERKQQILNICYSTNCEIKIIPSLFDLDTGEKILPQVQSINVENLLGRDVINLDNPELADFINNKVIFVTGVGSIGSELCRQMVKYGPKRLVMIDIYENNAYDIQQELVRNGYGNIITTEIASVRDSKKMRALFTQYKPQLVFHAAAHKHVPLMEDNPEEAVKNNVLGTFKVAKLCDEFSVQKMILISTDKAVNPTNIMGASKRCCEMVIQYMAQTSRDTDFAAVRFGNVLGSNGSVIPLFSKQIEAGGPVTVTHPDIIRYFMTIPEAVSLVLEAGTMAKGGEIFVLDMGEPVKITTLAENLIRLYGYQPYTEMPIKFVGLRPGEKLFEELLMSEEGLASTANKKIFIGRQIEIDADTFEDRIEALGRAATNNNKETVVKLLHDMVPTFKEPQKQELNA